MQKSGFSGSRLSGEKYMPVCELDKIERKLQLGILNVLHEGSNE
jgi:hypothetical protein